MPAEAAPAGMPLELPPGATFDPDPQTNRPAGS
jgi:hypothetical protein